MAAISRLNPVRGKLKSDVGLLPVMATEIEFYAPGLMQSQGSREAAVKFIAKLAAELPLANVNAEVGLDQFEVSFRPTRDIEKLAEDTEHFKALMKAKLPASGAKADFAAKPYDDQPGSGLHIHLHLEDATGVNQFTRAGRDMDDPFSDTLRHTIGGLLELMNASMKFFAPHEDSYRRFVKGANAPLTVSWGTNNRTVAVRLPAKALDNKHIEHRVAGSDADVASVLWAVMAGAHHGIVNALKPTDSIYGDASLAMYNLPPLARSLQEAEHLHATCVAFKHYTE